RKLLTESASLGPEVADEQARRLEVDQAEIVLTASGVAGTTIEQLHRLRPMYGVRLRALFRGGHELPLMPGTPLKKHDVLRIIGPTEAVRRATAALGLAVRPTNATDIVTLAFGIATGYLVGLITVPVAGIPLGLGAMGGVVVAGMVVSIVRSVNP